MLEGLVMSAPVSPIMLNACFGLRWAVKNNRPLSVRTKAARGHRPLLRDSLAKGVGCRV